MRNLDSSPLLPLTSYVAMRRSHPSPSSSFLICQRERRLLEAATAIEEIAMSNRAIRFGAFIKSIEAICGSVRGQEKVYLRPAVNCRVCIAPEAPLGFVSHLLSAQRWEGG